MNPIVELSPELTIQWISPNDLPAMWEDVRPLLEEACAYSRGQSTPRSVVDDVLNGDAQLIAFMRGLVPQSMLVLTVSDFPTGLRILEVLHVAGSGMKDWTKFEDEIDAWGKRFGCTRIRSISRPGVQRMLPHWDRTAVVLEREI